MMTRIVASLSLFALDVARPFASVFALLGPRARMSCYATAAPR